MAHFDFVEIGTCDFDTETQAAGDGVRGLAVDPMRIYLDALPSPAGVQKVCAAITDDAAGEAEVDVYWIPPDVIAARGKPRDLRGCTSIRAPHPLAASHGLADAVRTERVPLLSVGALFTMMGVASVDYLKIDTEGHDCVILRGLVRHCASHPAAWPRRIRFECNCWTQPQVVEDTLELLAKTGGYYVTARTLDDLELHRAPPDGGDGLVRGVYMAALGAASGCADVTPAVRRMLEDGGGGACTNEALGCDPCFCVPKQLHVLERVGGALRFQRVLEGQMLLRSDGAPPLYDAALLSRLEALWASGDGYEGHCGHTNGREPQALAEFVLALPSGARVLEIGFNCGHSAAAMLSARPDTTLVSLDLGVHSYVRAAKAVIDAAFPRRHVLVLGDSTQTLPRVLGDFDMYFVDGCHDYEVAAQDVDNVLARARPADLFVLDDVTPSRDYPWTAGPNRIWREVTAAARVRAVGVVDVGNGHGWAWGHVVAAPAAAAT